MGTPRTRGRGRQKKPTMATNADRHELYEMSVQDVDSEIDFVDDCYKRIRGRKATLLREDFCGTANTACEWIGRRKTNRAIGVDLDEEVQAWGIERHVKKLGPAADRLELIAADVLSVETEPADVILAMNFSYWIFKDRTTLGSYFKQAREGLKDDGLFIVDAYGGSDAYREMRERTDQEGFTYVWHQAKFDPISSDMLCHIHFSFPDGSRMRQAFTYEWRLWTLPEIRELLTKAGFKRSTIYWQGTDEDGEGNGEFEPASHGDADPAWIVYIVAEK